ncbi:MAG: hypothetical protein JWN81_2149 [Solirubrobacterales bacterium]|nr:hypothetical protein [Solirubrobacterales bacterium]
MNARPAVVGSRGERHAAHAHPEGEQAAGGQLGAK